MAGEMLLINPRRRRRANPVGKRRRSRRRHNPVTVVRARAPARRRNPVMALARRRRHSRRRNPVTMVRRTRRRNPLSLGNANMYVQALKQAAIGAGGAIGIDLLMGYIAPKLPASMQKVAGKVGVYEMVKAIGTIGLGFVLAKPTRGLSVKAAQGALTVQLAEMFRTFVPSTMTLGYSNPAWVVPGNMRIGPNRVGQYTGVPGPVLANGMGQYTGVPGPVLSRVPASQREGWRR